MFANAHAKSPTRSYAECLLNDYFSRGGTVTHIPAGVSGIPDSDDWMEWTPADDIEVAEFAARNGVSALA